jgi:hypothetical protein
MLRGDLIPLLHDAAARFDFPLHNAADRFDSLLHGAAGRQTSIQISSSRI